MLKKNGSSNEQQLSDVLSEFARTMLTDFPIQAILDHLVERIVEIMPVSGAGVTLISPNVKPRLVAASDDAALRFEKLQTELGEGPCVLAHGSGAAVAAGDLRHEDRFPNFAPRALEAGLEAVFTFPLRHGADRPLGALDLYRDTPGALSGEAMTAAQTLADVAAAYILNAQARSDLQDSRDQSRHAALHDDLTGLANRTLMLERLEHALLRDGRSGRTSALFFLDLDRFKAVNDTYGHAVGDELLLAVADRLVHLVRPADTLARFSGDEFVILCEDLDTAAQADAVASRLESGLAQPFVLSDVEVVVAASIGIAFADHHDCAPEALLREADKAMYQAKRQGGGRYQVLDLRQAALADDHRAALEEDLRGAMRDRELYLAYQPIVATVGGHVTDVEALLRWAHPTLGPVSASAIKVPAERLGLMGEIGQWVLEQAWTDREDWPGLPHGNSLAVSVNVSSHQLLAPGFATRVSSLVKRGGDPGLLTLELTEDILVGGGERAAFVLDDLKDIGVTLALDNFGTGSLSLLSLREFPIDVVKIDRTIIAELERSSLGSIIVNAVVQGAHELGMTVVAQGVETIEQYHQLAKLGCESCQGYYFARPMPRSDLATFMHHHLDANPPTLPEAAVDKTPLEISGRCPTHSSYRCQVE